ncbi:hypothetical protein [Friedmanniella luteola]|uniref:hypothetical protein n=1 Tax=Friedmanniella luteola TaxID=546871 RepID=UPI0012FE3353|nr:hypothetical protein [Friedmanniella luteola]
MAVLLIAALAAHLGRAVANRIAGAGWAFPDRADLFTSLPGLLTGDAAAGLPATTAPLATADTVLTLIVVVELMVLTAVSVVLKVGLGRWGPGRMRGMASRSEAKQLLGRTRLRRNAPIIRPDLYPTRRRRG